MWAPVVAANVLAIALGLGLPRLDEEITGSEGTLPIALSAAEQIFGALAAGMITFTGIVFSAVLVAAQIQTASYSPRLAARLRRDGVVIAALALSTATASYSLFALAAIGHRSDRLGLDAAPAITVVVGLALAFVTFVVFVALVQRAFDSTQIGGILRGLLHRAFQAVDEVHLHGSATPEPPGIRVEGGPVAEIRHSGTPAVLASVDRSALIRVAREAGAFIEIVPMVGQYIPPGAVTMRLHGTEQAPEARVAGRVLVLARQRTLDQDPAFALRIFVDIAIRGLSPAVNDPTTAVQAIDRIETLLVELHRRALGPSVVSGPDGTPLGLIHTPTWEEYLDLALVEIRHYGAGSAQVARRLHALHGHLLQIVDESQRGRVELERRLLAEQLEATFPDRDERDILSHPDPLGLGGAR